MGPWFEVQWMKRLAFNPPLNQGRINLLFITALKAHGIMAANLPLLFHVIRAFNEVHDQCHPLGIRLSSQHHCCIEGIIIYRVLGKYTVYFNLRLTQTVQSQYRLDEAIITQSPSFYQLFEPEWR